MLIYAPRAEPKRRARRSRSGCIQCKTKKLKCNEQRPRCGRCTERKTECEYKSDIWPKSQNIACNRKLTSRHDSCLANDLAVGQFRRLSDESDASAPDDGLRSPQAPSLDHLTDEQSSPECDSDEQNTQADYSAMQLQRFDFNSPHASPMSPRFELNIPLFAEITQPHNRRTLLNYFTSELSTLMTFSGDDGNPFRELVLPMCERSQPLLFAVLALSSAHLEFKGVTNKEASINLHTQALHFLSEALARQEGGHALVTAIIMLIYYETLVHRGQATDSAIVHGHLKAALSMLKPLSEDDSAINRFLSLALYFHDVIAALSTGTAAQPSTLNFQAVTLDLSKQPPLPTIDALLGLTSELWPIIHDISHVMKMRKEIRAVEALGYTEAAAALRLESTRRSDNIKIRLEEWRPIHSNGRDGASTPTTKRAIETDLRIQSIICNAEAYHHAAFVYFYRNIESQPRRSPLVQYHAKEALAACLRVVMFEGPMAALLWPLFVGACEAVKELDRGVARTVFQASMSRQGFVNIAQSWEVVQEVWREGDEEAREVSWEEIGQAQGLSLVFA